MRAVAVTANAIRHTSDSRFFVSVWEELKGGGIGSGIRACKSRLWAVTLTWVDHIRACCRRILLLMRVSGLFTPADVLT